MRNAREHPTCELVKADCLQVPMVTRLVLNLTSLPLLQLTVTATAASALLSSAATRRSNEPPEHLGKSYR